MHRICIIPCGKKKIWDHKPHAGEVKAAQAYIGTFHHLCQSYARMFFDDWYILSAKYGILEPEDMVSGHYDVGFQHKKHPELIRLEQLRQQLINKKLLNVEEIVVLGGKKHRRVVEEVFGSTYRFIFPLEGCPGIGYMLQKLKTAIHSQCEIK